MDSLMDALTNVVGILLLILIVLSLNITNSVVKVLEDLPEVSEEQLEEMRKSEDEAKKNLDKLKQTEDNFTENIKTPEQVLEIDQEIAELESENKELIEKRSDLDELNKTLVSLESDNETASNRVSEADQKNRELAAILAQTPEVAPVAAREIKMPNPRKSDPESAIHYLFCKNNKLYYVGDPYTHGLSIRDVIEKNQSDFLASSGKLGDYVYPVYKAQVGDKRLEAYQEDLRLTRSGRKKLAAWEELNLTWTNGKGEAAEEKNVIDRIVNADGKATVNVSRFRYDIDKILAYFKEDKGPRDFIYRVRQNGTSDTINFGVEPRPEGGWTSEQFLSEQGEFTAICRKAASSRSVIFYYYVAPDSFETYLAARDRTESFRIGAGWQIFSGDKIEPRPQAKRQSVEWDFANIDPQVYTQHANVIGPKLIEARNNEFSSFGNTIASLVPKDAPDQAAKDEFMTKLGAERRSYNSRYTQNWALNVYRTALAAQEVRPSREEIALQIHPPQVPGIRRPASLPSKPTPPPDPNKKPPPKKPTTPAPSGGITLD